MDKKILIADDHEIVRLGLSLIIKKLRPSTTIDEVDDYQKILDIIKKKSFDLIILDIKMPNGNFQDTLEIIKSKHSQTKIMVFSAQDETLFALRYLKMGAHGFLHKSSSEEEINSALIKMLDQGRYISDPVKETIIYENLNKQSPSRNPIKSLTDREMEVAERLIKGYSIKDISDELNIHISTVSTYKTRVLEKLKIQTIPDLIKIFSFYEISE